MKVTMVWGQRRCRYEGQFAPELLEAVSEYSDERIIDQAYKKYLLSDDFDNVVIVETSIKAGVIEHLLSKNMIISNFTHTDLHSKSLQIFRTGFKMFRRGFKIYFSRR